MNRILIVDDEYVIRESLSDFFSFVLSIDVQVAENGQEAWEIFQDKNFDLILTDIDMPEMNGIELVKKINQLNPHQNVIMMSGRDHSDEVNLLLKQGIVNGFLAKPFNLVDLKNYLTSMSA